LGVDRLRERVAQDGQLYTAGDYGLAQEFSAYRRQLDQRANYYFWIRLNLLANPRQFVLSNYTVEYIPASREARVTGLDYQLNYDENSDESDAYNDLPRGQYADPLIRRLIRQGEELVLRQARVRQQVPTDSVFNPTSEEISSRVAGDLTYYKFDVDLRDAARNLGVDSDFIIAYNRPLDRSAVVQADFDLTDNNSSDNDDDNDDYSDAVGKAPL